MSLINFEDGQVVWVVVCANDEGYNASCGAYKTPEAAVEYIVNWCNIEPEIDGEIRVERIHKAQCEWTISVGNEKCGFVKYSIVKSSLR